MSSRSGQRLGRPARAKAILDCGNSGTTMRLMIGVLAGAQFEEYSGRRCFIFQTPDGSCAHSAYSRWARKFQRSGRKKHAADYDFAAAICVASNTHSPVASAQVKSAILLAGLQAEGETIVIEPAPSSRSHRANVERFRRGGQAAKTCASKFARGDLRGTEVLVPGDISSARVFLVRGALRPGGKRGVQCRYESDAHRSTRCVGSNGRAS